MTDSFFSDALLRPTRRNLMTMMGGAALALSLPNMSASAENAVLRFAISAFPPNLNPWENTGATAGTVKLMLMRGLTGYSEKGELVGELAESWKLVDQTTYAFKLRDNAFFHNGKPVTSADIAYSLKKILADDSTAYLKRDLSVIKDVEIVDDKSFRLKLSEPSATLLYILGNCDCPMISADSTATEIIGAGPFRKKNDERGVFIEVERFDKFYKVGQPSVKGVRFVVYSDENLRYAALEAGDVDLIEYVPWQKFDAAEANPQLDIQTSLGPFMFLLFNASKGPFADARVRQAIGYAIERQDVVDAAFAGRGEPLLGFPNPQGSPFNLSDPASEWRYDPEKAKAMLAEAGYPNGFECRLLATSTYGMHQDTASVVQAHLQVIGINATLQLPDWGSRITAGKNGDYDIAVHGTSSFFNDPDALAALLRTSSGSFLQSFGFKSERIDALLQKGRAELDPVKREAIYKDLVRAYFEEVPQVPLNWRQQAYATNVKVKGFKNLPGFLNVLSGYTIDQITLG
ncbi:ABC transporter substrate-binding protein [Rhizobium miluonense]|uniref:Peptide/nickel transport system substrate-binding protein n=1 Tax=Rhizobium miluonense TaxID=411945 RepID=A0A1C3WDE4_9HYPH|nr:ABC transporter substrate-binding protein [Rhizobium miluonense]SCB37848.1 peptide/nickel transport system substrate-binding protein [Rhizobium miluonense]